MTQVCRFQTCVLGRLDCGSVDSTPADGTMQSGNSANSSVLDNVSQLALANVFLLIVFTTRRKIISNTAASFRFHLNVLMPTEI